MTTTTFDSRFDLSAPGIVRTWLVELRKLVDTPSGIALVATGAVLAGVFGGGTMLFREAPTLTSLVTMAGLPGGILAAVASVLLVTAEWTHRTALATYALTPRRGRVIAAKAAAAATLAVLVTVLALLAALVIAPVGTAVTGHSVTWTLDGRTLAVFSASNVCLALSACALAYLARNAPAPIVVLLVWPMVASLIRQAGPGAAEVLSWLDQDAVSGLAGATGLADLGRAATGMLVWIVVPGAVGVVRELRAQVR